MIFGRATAPALGYILIGTPEYTVGEEAGWNRQQPTQDEDRMPPRFGNERKVEQRR